MEEQWYEEKHVLDGLTPGGITVSLRGPEHWIRMYRPTPHVVIGANGIGRETCWNVTSTPVLACGEMYARREETPEEKEAVQKASAMTEDLSGHLLQNCQGLSGPTMPLRPPYPFPIRCK